METLSVKSLKVSYGFTEIVHGIEFSVNEREIITLIGSNGAGKTSSLRAISGLIREKSGDIQFKGENLLGLAADQIFNMGIIHVPEGRHVFPAMTVYENLLMGALFRRNRKEVKDDLLMVYEHFPILQSRTKQNGGLLSGGEQQMLAIGRALMSRPKLLLLDEPSLGLAPLIVKEIGRIIIVINKKDEGVPIVLVEQNAKMALDISERAYVLESGRIVYSGNSKDFLTREDLRRFYLGS